MPYKGVYIMEPPTAHTHSTIQTKHKICCLLQLPAQILFNKRAFNIPNQFFPAN